VVLNCQVRRATKIGSGWTEYGPYSEVNVLTARYRMPAAHRQRLSIYAPAHNLKYPMHTLAHTQHPLEPLLKKLIKVNFLSNTKKLTISYTAMHRGFLQYTLPFSFDP
jgi:hypothetical protein